MIGRKTAALIGESAWVGARAAGASGQVQDATRQFGVDLGLAFQIRDDLLGIWGDEDETGKSASSDISARKMTFPIIAALEYGPDDLRDELRSRYATAPVDGEEALIRGLLNAAGARQITSEFESRHWVAAMRALESMPLDAVWRQHIHEFARLFVGRRS
jgi:geranylgeranyl diphosphate synthase type I